MHSIRLHISGEFALFTRPETKVERVSYPLPTPSAARNILDSIFWKPEFRWLITSITVLKPLRWMSVRRNEVQSKIAPGEVKRWMNDPSTFQPLMAGAGQGTDGTPRSSNLLCDVAYVIEATPIVFAPGPAGDPNTPQKYIACFTRRANKGQCFSRPYLGCREFAADFRLATAEDVPTDPITQDVGRMLYDITFRQEGNQAVFFDAVIVNGVMDTHPDRVLSEEKARAEVLRCSYKR